MAFVAIDNPAGIQHHGGQMDWCRISPTRIAILTFTADNKALVQEANYSAGATVLGPASFLKQVTPRLPSPQVTYFKPRIKSLGSGRLFIMVPASFVAISTAAGSARLYGTGEYTTLNPTTDIPNTHTCIIAIRNADGTYTVDSSIDTRTQCIAEGNAYATYNTALDIEVNPNGLSIYLNQPVTANNLNQRLKMQNVLTLTAGKITAQSVGVSQMGVPQPSSNVAIAVRETLTPQLVPHKIYAFVNNFATAWLGAQNNTTGNIHREYWNINGGVLDVWPALVSNANGNYLNLGAYLPIDVAAKTFLYTGAWPGGIGGNCYLNNVVLSAGAQILNPLDSAWVTDTVACTIGMAGASNDNGNPNNYPAPCFDGDVAYSLNPAYHSVPNQSGSRVRALDLVFKSIVGGGLYVGPFDPIRTPYYTKDYFNFGQMIHRIDDTAFWIVGCFMDSPTGNQQLGVITVKS